MIIYNERTTLARATRVVIHSVAAIWGVQAVQCTGAPKGITPEIDFRDDRVHRMMSQAEPVF